MLGPGRHHATLVRLPDDRLVLTVIRRLDFDDGTLASYRRGCDAVVSRDHGETWDVEQRFHAIANGYFVGTINRVGTALKPDVQFYGHSYFCDPMGGVLAEAGEEEEIVVADLDLDQVAEVRANLPFYRDRRPDMYGVLTAP